MTSNKCRISRYCHANQRQCYRTVFTKEYYVLSAVHAVMQNSFTFWTICPLTFNYIVLARRIMRPISQLLWAITSNGRPYTLLVHKQIISLSHHTYQYGSSNSALNRFTPVQCMGSCLAFSVPPKSKYAWHHAAYRIISIAESIGGLALLSSTPLKLLFFRYGWWRARYCLAPPYISLILWLNDLVRCRPFGPYVHRFLDHMGDTHYNPYSKVLILNHMLENQRWSTLGCLL